MLEELDDYDWNEVFGYANAYDSRTRKDRKQYTRDDVTEIIAMVNGENDGADWVGVFLMSDGKYLTIRAGCDYTGWDCQAGGTSEYSDTLADAVAFGLTRDEYDRLATQFNKGKSV